MSPWDTEQSCSYRLFAERNGCTSSAARAAKAWPQGTADRANSMRCPQLVSGRGAVALPHPHPTPLEYVWELFGDSSCLPWTGHKGTWGTFLCFPQRLWPCAHEWWGRCSSAHLLWKQHQPRQKPTVSGQRAGPERRWERGSGLDPQTWPLPGSWQVLSEFQFPPLKRAEAPEATATSPTLETS